MSSAWKRQLAACRQVSHEEVARRELLEELGGGAAELRFVSQFYTSNGISNEVAYVYLATGVQLGKTHREPTELMEMRLVPVAEALQMAREGKTAEGLSALAPLWWEPPLNSDRFSCDQARLKKLAASPDEEITAMAGLVPEIGSRSPSRPNPRINPESDFRQMTPAW